MRDRIRAAPIGCSDARGCATRKPSSPADAVTKYRIGGTRADEGCSNARKRNGAVRTKEVCPPSFVTSEAPIERDVSGPMPKFARIPDMRGFPLSLAIAERGRCIRSENAPSRKRYKPSALRPAAAMVKRKGDSFPCFIPGNSSQEDALLLALEINPFEKLLASALIPSAQACVRYN